MESVSVERAHLQVRGQGQTEQSLKASVDPGEPEVQEMVETVLTPPHPDALETLLDEPLTGTLDHAAPKRQSQVLGLRIVDVIPVPIQVRIQRDQSVPGGLRQALDFQGLDQVC